MTEAIKSYSKAELIGILTEKCPKALAEFPSPDTFEFRTYKRKGKDNVATKIGFRITKAARNVKGELWIEEYRTTDPANLPWLRPAYARKVIGRAGPMAGYDDIYGPAYGREAKHPRKRLEKQNGLYYTDAARKSVNNMVCNANKIKGNELFGKLHNSGFIGPYSDMVRALLRFILVHCGHADRFEEFKNPHHNIVGLKPLIRAFNAVTRPAPPEEEASEPTAGEYEDYEDYETEYEISLSDN